MKTKDDMLLEEAYSKILKEEISNQTKKPFSFEYEDAIPNNIGYSNRTFNVRGKDVLVKIEWDTEPDTGWYNFITLVDPVTKERVFKDIPEEEIKKLWKTS